MDCSSLTTKLLGESFYSETPKKKLSKKAIKHKNNEILLKALFNHSQVVDHFMDNIRNCYININGIDYNHQLKHKEIKKIIQESDGTFNVKVPRELLTELRIKCIQYLNIDVDINFIGLYTSTHDKLNKIKYNRIYMSLTSDIDHQYLNILEKDVSKKFTGCEFTFSKEGTIINWATIQSTDIVYVDKKYNIEVSEIRGDWTPIYLEFQVIPTKDLWFNLNFYLDKIPGPIGMLCHPDNNELWVKIANNLIDYKIRKEWVLIKSYRDLTDNKLIKKEYFGVQGVDLYRLEDGLLLSDITMELFICIILE